MMISSLPKDRRTPNTTGFLVQKKHDPARQTKTNQHNAGVRVNETESMTLFYSRIMTTKFFDCESLVVGMTCSRSQNRRVFLIVHFNFPAVEVPTKKKERASKTMMSSNKGGYGRRDLTVNIANWRHEPLAANDLRNFQKEELSVKKNTVSIMIPKRRVLDDSSSSSSSSSSLDNTRVHSKEMALRLLKRLVLDAIVENKTKKNSERWNFASVPLRCYNKTMDDILLAFLHWARMDDKNEIYDVNKAFTRMDEYATWMYLRRDDLRGLTNESIQPAWKAWDIRVSADSAQRVIWWMDLASVDLYDLARLTVKDSVRLFAWFAHYLLFRHQTQEHGVVVVVNMAQVDFQTFHSILPTTLGRTLERLIIQVVPVKIKHIYLTGSPKWCNIFVSMIKPFLSQDTRDRIETLELRELEDSIGAECMPEGFGRYLHHSPNPADNDDIVAVEQQGTLLRPSAVATLTPSKPKGTLLREWH